MLIHDVDWGVFDSRIKLADGEGFTSNEVVQLVGRRGVEETISDPSACLDADGGLVVAGQ